MSVTSAKGFVAGGKPVEDDGRYYIESVGSFTPSGYPKVGMPQLKTSLWTCKRSWSPDCEFP